MEEVQTSASHYNKHSILLIKTFRIKKKHKLIFLLMDRQSIQNKKYIKLFSKLNNKNKIIYSKKKINSKYNLCVKTKKIKR